jgi:prevent-host-death family protein
VTEDVVSFSQARRHWWRLLRRVEQGQAFLITRRGRIVARLVPIDEPDARGRTAGALEVSP